MPDGRPGAKQGRGLRLRHGLALSLVAIAGLGPAAAAEAPCVTASTGAGCATPLGGGGTSAKRIRVAPSTPRYGVGDVLPRGRYQMLLNSEYYGLPPVDGDWRYFEVEGRVLRVRPDTLEVLEDATAEANAAF